MKFPQKYVETWSLD